jgi:hypothetical protein
MPPKTDALAEAICATLASPNESDSNLEAANVVDGLFAIARAINHLATQVKYLGGGDNASTMGAIEYLALHLGDKIGDLADATDRAAGTD